MKIKSYILFLVILFYSVQYAQPDTLHFNLEPVLDEYLQEDAPEDNYSVLYDYYYNISIERPEINKSGIYGLMKIPFMDYNTAMKILDYKKNYGYIFSFRELFSIKEIDTATIQLIAPFITVNNRTVDNSSGDAPKENIFLRSRFGYDIQERRGFKENKFEGNRLKSYQRANIGFDKNYSFAFLAEKDPGEISYTDHFNFYFNFRNTGIIRNAVIGDYTAEFGQGLALGGNALTYNSINASSNFKRFRNSFSPYCGTYENTFFRGAAIEAETNGFSLTFFYSNNTFDAAIDTMLNITSIPLTGLHRTETELAYKNKGREKLWGISAGYISRFADAGFLFYNGKFNNPIALSNQVIPSKSEFSAGSVYYSFNINEFIFTGETAYDGNKFSTINALEIEADKHIRFLISHRDYSTDFFSFHANAFGSRGANNQSGIYTGIRIKTEFGTFNVNYDRGSAGTPSASDIFPSKETQLLINFSSNKLAGIALNLRYLNTLKENTMQNLTGQIRLNSFRAQIKDIPWGNFVFKETFYYSHFSENIFERKESGCALIQDLLYNIKPELILTIHAAWFSTETFSSVIYAYENDLPGSASITPLYGRGFKYSLILNYTPTSEIAIGLKYSSLTKPSEASLGAGYSEIFNNIDNKVSLQAEFRIK